MPVSPPRTCNNFAQCGGSTRSGSYCAQCKPSKQSLPKAFTCAPEPPASKPKRIYDSLQWRNMRVRFLSENPFCVGKLPDGICNRAATEVDHVVAIEDGGEPWIWDNLQALCHRCHSRKTARENGGFGNARASGGKKLVTIVCGPPGAGKSTYVKANAQPGDLIIDFDLIAMALTGLPQWGRDQKLMHFVYEARDAVLLKLQSTPHVRAWIIECAPNAVRREALRRRFNAETVVILPEKENVLKRLRERSGTQDWYQIASEWYSAYRPGDGERVISN